MTRGGGGGGASLGSRRTALPVPNYWLWQSVFLLILPTSSLSPTRISEVIQNLFWPVQHWSSSRALSTHVCLRKGAQPIHSTCKAHWYVCVLHDVFIPTAISFVFIMCHSLRISCRLASWWAICYDIPCKGVCAPAYDAFMSPKETPCFEKRKHISSHRHSFSYSVCVVCEVTYFTGRFEQYLPSNCVVSGAGRLNVVMIVKIGSNTLSRVRSYDQGANEYVHKILAMKTLENSHFEERDAYERAAFRLRLLWMECG
jgi:hypothetical protein